MYAVFLLLLFISALEPRASYSADGPRLNDTQRLKVLAAVRSFLANPESDQIELQFEFAKSIPMAVISLSRPAAPARVSSGKGNSLAEVLRQAALELRNNLHDTELTSGRLKIDLAVEVGKPVAFDRQGRAAINRNLQGLWLPEADLLLTPEELTARKLVTTEGDLQSKTLAAYLKEARGRSLEGNPGKSGKKYSTVQFDSFMETPAAEIAILYRGNPQPTLEPAALLKACVLGGDYLVRHQRLDGLFDYSYEPKTNELNKGYNELRHAGTAYALLELYAVTKEQRYRLAAERAIEAMFRWVHASKDHNFETLVFQGEEAKLGGAALAALALLKYEEVTGEKKWREHVYRFAQFLVFQQQQDGRFESKYFLGEPDDEVFESLYYPGEAILALTRLHAVDPENPVWLQAAIKAVNWLVNQRDAQKSIKELPHDHWLLIGLNELYPYTRDKQHLQHAERIAAAILGAQRNNSEVPDWIGSFYDPPRSTPTATRAEAMVAMWNLAGKTGRKQDPFLEALRKMAVFQLRCQLIPENALYLPRPDIAMGGFRRSMDNWEVRIDYVQHNISSLLGLRRILLDIQAK